MSTAYRIYCLDCDVWDFEHENDENTVALILSHANELADLAKLTDELSELSIEVKRYGSYVHPEWFLMHKGHNLAVKDEYGHLSSQCRKSVRCPHCRYQGNCKLDMNHEGDCQIEER